MKIDQRRRRERNAAGEAPSEPTRVPGDALGVLVALGVLGERRIAVLRHDTRRLGEHLRNGLYSVADGNVASSPPSKVSWAEQCSARWHQLSGALLNAPCRRRCANIRNRASLEAPEQPDKTFAFFCAVSFILFVLLAFCSTPPAPSEPPSPDYESLEVAGSTVPPLCPSAPFRDEFCAARAPIHAIIGDPLPLRSHSLR
ncbi:hypothetical protein QR680_017545 [Steinernema hermaphroditum]|uniref:Uncharacterized protein n=1 Tax=Steinernema hermaphroditum TaxID=289476 RepID=A0AA39LP80_9BILA|nr:hypothetical protein QR680_017545 [Steinernema hermaphroditum]